ncbi:pre-mrna-splicing regulator wtap [Ophiocordyceps camponoti-floridani]|uniref:Pre-mrna-splicing regulator wtap n=1 Tax=Ophiocordyceps camponoti-floridani TaxID=2030778 RepID=A0A8H4VGH0_9HYPO|nr:pre-mrna-splicing regulator wtap [Ophiocordyceps camponoti-floridani]
MARFLIWALAALGSVNAQLLGVGVGIGNTNNNNNGFSNGVNNGLNNGLNNGNQDGNNRQLRNLLGNTLPRLLPPGACRRGRATVQVTPVKVVRKTPVLVSAFFPRDTHVPIDRHNTLIVKNAPVHVYTIITRTRYQTTTCARLLRTRQTPSCNVNVIGVIGDPNNDPGQCTRVNPNPACLSAANLPAACSGLANSNGLALTPLISLCVTALGGLNVGAVASCLVTSLISTSTTGQSIVTCLTNALSNTCMTALPGTCISLAGLVTISLGGLQACQTSLGPMNSGAAAACFTQNSNGNDLILCLQNALGLVIGRDANGQPCIPNDNIGLGTGGGGLLGGLLGNNGLLGINLGGLTSGLGGTVGGVTGGLGGLTGGLGGLGGGLVRNRLAAAPAASEAPVSAESFSAESFSAENAAVPSDSAADTSTSVATPSASVDLTSATDSISLPTVTATSISTPAVIPPVVAA